MALFTPSASPAVTVKEIDLTGVVPNVQTSTGAFVGNFGWGPVGEVTLVSDESGLVSRFSAPTDDNTVDFHSAAYFLRYSNSLQVVREVDSDAKNAFAVNSNLAGGVPSSQQLGNLDAFEAATISDSDGSFIAKYPGVLGNSLQVSYCAVVDSDNGGTLAFDNWTYKDKFDAAPGSSKFVSDLGGKNDEMHVVVIDQDGAITGTAGEVLETFPFLSVAKNAKRSDGTSNYYKDVIKLQSDWIYAGDFFIGDSAGVSDVAGAVWGEDAAVSGARSAALDAAGGDFHASGPSVAAQTVSLKLGASSSSLGTDDILRGFDKFEDKDAVEIDFLIAPESLTDTPATTVVNDLVSTASSLRKDCVVVASPSRNAVVTVGTNAAVLTCNNTYTKSSYLIHDNNYIKVFDKYNDKYIKIPAASSTAGLMAATDLVLP